MTELKNIGYFEISEFQKESITTLDFLPLGGSRNYEKGLIEFDVTEGMNKIRDHEKNTGEKIPFIVWLLKCIGQAASEYKEVHSMIIGRKKIIKFNDVDIAIVSGGIDKGVKPHMPLVIRKTNEKTVKQIYDEVIKGQSEEVNRATVLGNHKKKKERNLPLSIPKSFTGLISKRTVKDPFKVKQFMGTIIVTNFGMFNKFHGWPIPTTAHPLAFGVGGITKKPGVVEDKIEIREYLALTVLFNYDVVDDALATGFITRLGELIESGFGLLNLESFIFF